MSGAAAEPSFINNKQDQFNEALHEHPQVQAGHVDGSVTLTVGPLEPMEPIEAPPLLRVRPTGCSYRRMLCKSRFGGDARASVAKMIGDESRGRDTRWRC